MKILITGGAGFLGLKICHYLGADECRGNSSPHEIIVLDPRGCPENYLNSCCRATHDGAKIKFVNGDVCEFDAVQSLAEQVDVIFHLAFVVGSPACDKEPERAKKTALEGTGNIIRAAQGKLIVLPSSDVIYGKGARGSCKETMSDNPASLYGKLKLQCEEMVKESSQYCILRIPSNFGSSVSMKWDLLVNFLCRQMLKQGRISISDPHVTRALIHVQDTGLAFRFVLDNQSKCSGKVFNIASGAWTKREIAETIANVIGGKVTYEQTYIDPDRRDFTLDCSVINELGWNPKFNLKQGIEHIKASF